MTYEEVVERILQERIIAILRLSESVQLPRIVDILSEAGISLIEVTLDTPNALDLIKTLSAKLPNCIFGAGTVLGSLAAQEAIDAGAQFLVSPIFEEEVVDVALDNDVVSIIGAFTPTEIYTADMYGATFIKVFPLAGIGASYLKALTGPFPETLFIPTNRVMIETIQEYFDAGAVAVGLGSTLVNDADVAAGRFDLIKERAMKAREIVG